MKTCAKNCAGGPKKWLNEKGTLIQELVDKGSIEEMFGETKLVCRKWCPQTTKLISNDGQELRKKWTVVKVDGTLQTTIESVK